MTKKTLVQNNPGKQVFLTTARQAHSNFALVSFNFQRSKQNLKELGFPTAPIENLQQAETIRKNSS